MHSTLYPVTTFILSILLQTGTLQDTPNWIPHTTMGATCPDIHHARATPNTTPLITVSLAPGTPWALDHTQGRHLSHIHTQRPPYIPAPQIGHYLGLTVRFLLRMRQLQTTRTPSR